MNNNYIQITILNLNQLQKEIIIALLSSINFEGFEEKEDDLIAFINENDFNAAAFNEFRDQFEFRYEQTILPNQNWNKLWESNFAPVIINDFVAVRAFFHPAIANVKHQIIITPKMSFGTGHHATTYMMMEQMQHINFKQKKVFDFGTGTGILAILAEKLGAASVTAIDNDEWSITNAQENIETNNCLLINLQLSADCNRLQNVDVILANINKNIIVENFEALCTQLGNNGILILSGLLQQDESEIMVKAGQLSLHHILTKHKHQWVCLQFCKKSQNLFRHG